MSNTPQLFSFQGKVLIASRLPTGKPGPAAWVGNASQCQVKLSTTTDDSQESYSGQRLQIGRMIKSLKCDVSLTLTEWSPTSIALGLYGQQAIVPAGTVTGEPLPTVQTGDLVKLAYGGVTNLALTDSSATPKPVTASNYSLPQSVVASGNNGIISFDDLDTTYTQPLQAAYSYSGSVNVAMFSAQAPERYLILDGVDTETGNSVTVRLYRLRLDPTSQLDLINDGYGSFPLSGSALYDALNAADASLGGFGRIERGGSTS